jgi:hypothetical protein
LKNLETQNVSMVKDGRGYISVEHSHEKPQVQQQSAIPDKKRTILLDSPPHLLIVKSHVK